MKEKFQIYLMEEAKQFVLNQDQKTKEKIAFVIQKSKLVNDPKVFKKLNSNIWEYRIKSKNKELRLLAFWDKTLKSFVICTHGSIKKTQKVPKNELKKAENLMNEYFNDLNTKK